MPTPFILEASSGGGSAASLIILPLMMGGMYFLLIRPQRRRMRAQGSMQKSLGEGDEIITTSGMYGFITGFDGDIVWIEIDDNIQIRVARAAIQRKVDTSVGSEETSEPRKRFLGRGGTDDSNDISGDISGDSSGESDK